MVRKQQLFRLGARRILTAPSALLLDTIVYFGSFVLAFVNIFVAAGGDYKQWGLLAFFPYLLAAAGTFRLHQIDPDSKRTILWRRWIVVGLFFTSLVAPLSVSIAQRTLATPGVHAQAEVVVIERCGDRVATNQDCYLSNPSTVGVSATNYSSRLDANAFVPYLPGMAIFGISNSLPIPSPFRDARVAMTIFTVLVVLIALAISGLSSEDRWRIFQFALVLPAGALPLVTGGDDLPVIALLLLAVILSRKRRPMAAGLAAGAAVIMKLTAWPLALFLLFVQRDNEDNQAWQPYLISIASIFIPVISIAAAVNPQAFIVNELLFPLGLTKVKSPAQSPLLGQAIFSMFPGYRIEVVSILVLVGALLAVLVYRKWRPRGLGATIGFAAFILTLATVLAPATRFGYLLYPCNFVLWATIMRNPGKEKTTATTALGEAPMADEAYLS